MRSRIGARPKAPVVIRTRARTNDLRGGGSMWRTDTLWFDVAIVMSIFAIGNILFGRFEEHRSRLRRVLKVVLFLAITLSLSATVGRWWAYGVLAVPLLAATWVHLVWLPRNGVNGWTAEPRDRYLELVRGRSRG